MHDMVPGYKGWKTLCLHQMLRVQVSETREKRFLDEANQEAEDAQTNGES